MIDDWWKAVHLILGGWLLSTPFYSQFGSCRLNDKTFEPLSWNGSTMKPYHWHTKVQLKQKKLDRNQLWFMATIDTDGSKSPIVINPLQYQAPTTKTSPLPLPWTAKTRWTIPVGPEYSDLGMGQTQGCCIYWLAMTSCIAGCCVYTLPVVDPYMWFASVKYMFRVTWTDDPPWLCFIRLDCPWAGAGI